jgi:hypothetical protein
MAQDSSFTPQCDENFKPKVGIIFEGLEAIKELYKSYAHHVGIGVRVGQQKKLDNHLVQTKRFMCNRKGFKTQKSEVISGPFQKRRKKIDTRCGWDEHIFYQTMRRKHLQAIVMG